MELESLNEGAVIEVEKLGKILGYSDLRSITKWCADEGVIIFRQGKQRLVSRTQFLLAFYQPLIYELRQLHPKNWAKLFEAFLSGDFESAVNETLNDQVIKGKRYKAISKGGKNFLSSI